MHRPQQHSPLASPPLASNEGGRAIGAVVMAYLLQCTPLLPLSPGTVYRYTNGEATFYGFEASGTYALLDELSVSVGTSYLWGHDDALDERALGVSPFSINSGARFETPGGRFFAESIVHIVAEQDRVSPTPGETFTEG